MKNRIICIITTALFFLPSIVWARSGTKAYSYEKRSEIEFYRRQQKNKIFSQSLKGKSPEELRQAVLKLREEQFKENMDFQSQLHQERMEELDQRLADNKRFTDAQKQDLRIFAEQQYRENMSFLNRMYQEDMEFFKKITGDTGLSRDQEKAALKAHLNEIKARTHSYDMHQRNERMAKMQRMHKVFRPKNR